MTDQALKTEIVWAVVFEVILMSIAGGAALVEAWGVFAGFAFFCLIFPIWITAISTAIIAAEALSND